MIGFHSRGNISVCGAHGLAQALLSVNWGKSGESSRSNTSGMFKKRRFSASAAGLPNPRLTGSGGVCSRGCQSTLNFGFLPLYRLISLGRAGSSRSWLVGFPYPGKSFLEFHLMIVQSVSYIRLYEQSQRPELSTAHVFRQRSNSMHAYPVETDTHKG